MSGSRILFVSYWSLGEPLIASMVVPYVRILSERDDVEHISLVTIGSTPTKRAVQLPALEKVTHHAIAAREGLPHLLSKAELSLRTAGVLASIIRRERIGLAVAATSMAGTPVHAAARRTGIPYVVYCFEPHADYMAECGDWPRNGLKYRFARRMERTQLAHAFRVLTVTDIFRQELVAHGHDPARLRTMPCVIDTDAFRFSPSARTEVRAELGVPNEALMGVYAGKFGGLYFDQEAFQVFKAMMDRFPGSHMLVLSTMDHAGIRAKASAAGIALERFHMRAVPHAQMPAQLSAADMAFSTIRFTPSKHAQCPVKNGEYWAAGLPVLMTDGIGDDHLLMRQGIGGVPFDPTLTGLAGALDRMAGIMASSQVREQLHALAVRTRSLSIAERALDEVMRALPRASPAE